MSQIKDQGVVPCRLTAAPQKDPNTPCTQRHHSGLWDTPKGPVFRGPEQEESITNIKQNYKLEIRDTYQYISESPQWIPRGYPH